MTKKPRRSYTKYTRIDENKTTIGRNINRYQHDPISFYEGENERMEIAPIKAVRLG